MSNSKLKTLYGVSRSEAKAELKSFIEDNKAEFLQNKYNGVTVLVVTPFTGANTVDIATAIMSPDEAKFKPTLGKYIAYSNYCDGKFISLPVIWLNDVLISLQVS
jgi:hypothetical protein